MVPTNASRQPLAWLHRLSVHGVAVDKNAGTGGLGPRYQAVRLLRSRGEAMSDQRFHDALEQVRLDRMVYSDTLYGDEIDRILSALRAVGGLRTPGTFEACNQCSRTMADFELFGCAGLPVCSILEGRKNDIED